jgi:hypothetical protein
MPVQDASAVTDQTPLRLQMAVEIAFPTGGMTVSGLRREASKGRLRTELIAGKVFTTLQDIRAMREKCRVPLKEPDFGSNQKNVTAKARSSDAPHGLSGTVRSRSARAALERTAQELKGRSANSSLASTKFLESADVIPLRSSSSMS